MTRDRRTILKTLIYVVLVPLVERMMWLLHIPEILGEHAIVSWIDDQIAERLGIKSPTVDQVVKFVVTWGPAALFAALLLAAGWIVVTNAIAKRAKPRALGPTLSAVEQSRTATRQLAPEPDVQLGEALWRAFLKTWDKRKHDPNLMATTEPWPGYWDQFHSFVETDVRQAAFDGKLPIWGRKVGNWVLEQTQRPVREQIPSDFWKHNSIEVLGFLYHDPEKLTTTADALSAEKGKWRDLWTNRDAVERVWPSSNQGPLRIDVGEAGEFFETKRAGSLYTRTRILKLRISNYGSHEALTGCKVHVTDIEPHEYEGPWLLKEGFSLAAGDHEFVPLARYKEPDNIKISPYGDTFMEILATRNRPKPSSSVENVLTIRATSLNSPFCEIKCKLWVDDTGRLRIERAERWV